MGRSTAQFVQYFAIYTQKKSSAPTTELASQRIGEDDCGGSRELRRIRKRPPIFHRMSKAAARSGDARPAARRALRQNAVERPHGRSPRRIRQVLDPPIHVERDGREAAALRTTRRCASEQGPWRGVAAQQRRVATSCSPGSGAVQTTVIRPSGSTGGRTGISSMSVPEAGDRPLVKPGSRDRLRRRQKCRKARGSGAIPASDASFFFSASPPRSRAARSRRRERRDDEHSQRAGSRQACRRRGRCPCRPGAPRHARR